MDQAVTEASPMARASEEREERGEYGERGSRGEGPDLGPLDSQD